MALTNNQDQAAGWGLLRGPYLLAAYLLGLVLLYLGERLVGGQGMGRWLSSGMGVLLVLGACLGWLLAWLGSGGQARRAEGLALLLGLGGVLALLVYLVGSDLVLGPAPLAKNQGVGTRQILAAAWPVLLACFLLPLLFVQVSATSMGRGRGVEPSRLLASARSGATVALLLSTLFLVNAIANRLDVHTDLSYFKTTSPSEATRSLVTGLDKDTKALLFFPPANEVLVEVEPYFRELAGLSGRFSYRVVDRALEPELARKRHISSDGTILLLRGEASEKISLGDKLDRAKRTLRKFDKEFLEKMLKLERHRDVVYFITGHGERSADYNPTETRPRMSVLKKFLQALNMIVKNLGPTEGLAAGVPGDAALLVWLDPAGTLFPGEARALTEYLERGGRLLLALDTDSQGAATPVLEQLSLDYHPVKLANQRAHVVVDNAPSDVYNIITNSFTSHPAVATISRAARYFPVLAPTTGYLEKRTGQKRQPKRRVIFTIRSMPQTWADENGNGRRDQDEAGRVFQLAAAVSWRVKDQDPPAGSRDKAGGEKTGKDSRTGSEAAAGKQDGDKKSPAGKEKAGKGKSGKGAFDKQTREARAVVLADSDMLADQFIGFRVGYTEVGGNLQLLADSLRWLLDEGRVPGVPETEEDVKIVHTRDEDKLWFYGMVFVVPLLILAMGVATRWGRGRKRRTV
ncbi:MAG: hypothetical protein DRI34_12145 [Deltaproteobacteria bacterium]|nr:MAG: hypothetical protein DRI34_12145 [Deltaproteobacteria bacterium]